MNSTGPSGISTQSKRKSIPASRFTRGDFRTHSIKHFRSAALCCALTAILCGCSFRSHRGADSPPELLNAYIEGLQHRDEAAIRRLIPADHEAATAIRLKVSALSHPVIYHVGVDLRF